MYLTKSCCNNISTSCTCNSTYYNQQSQNNSNAISQCYIVGIADAHVGSIIDIKWDGEESYKSVRNVTRPNSHSFILGTDTLPIGYSWDDTNNILYFPPNEIVSEDQFAIWTSNGLDTACQAYVFTATSICVTVESGPCHELQP